VPATCGYGVSVRCHVKLVEGNSYVRAVARGVGVAVFARCVDEEFGAWEWERGLVNTIDGGWETRRWLRTAFEVRVVECDARVDDIRACAFAGCAVVCVGCASWKMRGEAG